eukprot:13398324-Ditylum_brightwellii.AAC.1
MKGKTIKKIPADNTVIPLPGEDPLHMVSLPLAIPVSYEHGLQTGKVTTEDLRYDSEAYHPLMGLWADTLAYQLSPATGFSGLTQKKDDVPNSRGFEARDDGLLPVVALLEECSDDGAFISNITRCLDYVKNSNIATWLKDHPDWVDRNAAVSPRASKSPHAAVCAHSVASIQDATVATSSTSPDGRVARHKIW